MEDKKFEILDHTADVRLRAYGKDKKELFGNALLGMMSVLVPIKVGTFTTTREIEIEAIDENALLVDFLSEALYYSQMEDETFLEVNFDEFGETKIIARIKCAKVEGFEKEIKAVSYQDVEIKGTKDGWEATMIFDV